MDVPTASTSQKKPQHASGHIRRFLTWMRFKLVGPFDKADRLSTEEVTRDDSSYSEYSSRAVESATHPKSWSKQCSDKLEDWSARYKHSRIASHTFRMMRAHDSEAGEGSAGVASNPSAQCSLNKTTDAQPQPTAVESASSGMSDARSHSLEGAFEATEAKETQATPSSNTAALVTGPPLFTREFSADQDVTLAKNASISLPEDAARRGSAGSVASTVQPLQPVLMPRVLEAGEPMLKVTQKKVMQRIFRLDADRGQILWESKKNNRVDLESIQEVRTGASASSYRISLSISAIHEPRWLSIIYQSRGQWKALHLIALSDESLERWRNTLLALQNLRRSLMDGLGLAEQRQSLWLRQHWREADSSQDEKLDFDEIMKLCRRLGIESSRRDLRLRFQESDHLNRGYLDFADFQEFVKHLKRRPDVEQIFNEWADVGQIQSADSVDTASMDDHGVLARKSHGLSIKRFEQFLREEQLMFSGESARQRTQELFDKYRFACADMELEGFMAFLISADNSVLASTAFASVEVPESSGTNGGDCVSSAAEVKVAATSTPDVQYASRSDDLRSSDQDNTCSSTAISRSSNPSRAAAVTKEELLAAGAPSSPLITDDMSQPLCDYFISSSHNTYLVGGQWKGDSTVEGYIRALQQGARSVELDCWDGPSNTPQITHGRTLTSKVPFSDVITAIARYAFVASPYPLILSLEVHADVQQQDVMAQILRDKFGDMLLASRLGSDGTPEEEIKVLPSPMELKGKILVKTKNLTLPKAEKARSERALSASYSESIVVEAPSTATDTTTESESDNFLVNARELVRSVTKRSGASGSKEVKKEKLLMSPSLASLLIYTVGVQHRGLSKRETYAVEHMISLSEKSAFKYVRDKVAVEDLVKHNRTHLTRIYPSMSSIARLHASANFLPHHFWATGSQLVALNFQTMDLGTELNQAMFARNGRCGFVLKPEALRIREGNKSTRERLRLAVEVTIISAQQLPRFKDNVRDKEREKDKDKDQNDDSDVIDPFVAAAILTPLSWGQQPGSQSEGTTAWATQPANDTEDVEMMTSRQEHLRRTSSSSVAALAGSPPGRVSNAPPVSTQGQHIRSSSAGSLASIPTPRVLGRPTTPTSANHRSKNISDVGTPVSALVTSTLSTPSVSPPNPPSILQRQRSNSSATTASVRNSLIGTSTSRLRTLTVKGNGFNPTWQQKLSLLLDVPAGSDASELLAALQRKHQQTEKSDINTVVDEPPSTSDKFTLSEIQSLCRGLLDLCFLRFEVCGGDGAGPTSSSGTSSGAGDPACLAAYTISLGALQQGYRHVPLYDSQLCQFLFSTLFIHTRIRVVGLQGEKILNSTAFDLTSASRKTSSRNADKSNGKKEFENLAPLMRAASQKGR